MKRPIVLTGGGTGGHLYPMLAIAEALIAAGTSVDELRFVGSRRGQDARILQGSPIELHLLPGRGLRRSWSARALRANLKAVGSLTVAFAQSLVLLVRWRPRVVVSVGGYAALTTSLAAIVCRRRLVIVDLDAAPSLTNQLVGRFATKRCVAAGSESDDVVVTGTPLRRDVTRIDRSPTQRQLVRSRLDPPIDHDRLVIVIMTGSLGATSVNRAVSELAHRWRDRRDLCLVHISGRRDFDLVTSLAPVSDGLDYRIEPYGDMSVWWGVADIAVCRAGATTVAELTALAIPAVLIPLPGAPGDHQSANALTLERVGAAVIIHDTALTGDVLETVLNQLLHLERRLEMERSLSHLGRPNAAAHVASVILDVAQ